MSRNLLGVPRIEYTVGDYSAVAAEDVQIGAKTQPKINVPSWVDKVKDAIPIEVVTAWAAIEGAIGKDLPVEALPLGPLTVNPYLALVAAMAVITAAHMWVDVESPDPESPLPRPYLKQTQYAQIALAVLGFLVWAYYLGELYGRVGWYDTTTATILLPLYVVAGPQLVPGVLRKLHGVEVPEDGRRQRAGSGSGE